MNYSCCCCGHNEGGWDESSLLQRRSTRGRGSLLGQQTFVMAETCANWKRRFHSLQAASVFGNHETNGGRHVNILMSRAHGPESYTSRSVVTCLIHILVSSHPENQLTLNRSRKTCSFLFRCPGRCSSGGITFHAKPVAFKKKCPCLFCKLRMIPCHSVLTSRFALKLAFL